MRLRRIEAERYGALAEARLGELGDGLTVVLGPNEAGKSTFATLVRHVLYGFPTRGLEAGLYKPPGGKRLGRLVFEDESGAHTLERADGPNGGPATLWGHGPDDAQTFVARLTRGVTDEAYRSVFGFSLKELADAGALDSVAGKLTATVAGLSENPQAVVDDLDKRARDLYNPGASKPRLNALTRELKEARREVAEAERTLADRSEGRGTLEELGTRLTALGEEAETASRRASVAGTVSAKLDAIAREVRARKERAGKLAADREGWEREIAALHDVTATLSSAEAVDSLDQAYDAFQRALERFSTSREDASRAADTTAAAVDALGAEWDAERVESVGVDQTTLPTLEDLGERMAQAERDERTAAERLAAAQAAVEPARRNAATALSSAGLKASAGISEVDAAMASQAAGVPASSGAGGSRAGVVVDALVAVAGAALAVWGALTGELLSLVLGLLVTAGGVAAAALALRAGKSAGAPAGAAADPLRIARLESARTALTDLARIQAGAAQEEAAAQRATAAADAAREAWRSWLGSVGLGQHALTPAAGRTLVTALIQARAAQRDERTATRRLTEGQAVVAEYRDRVAAAGLLPANADPSEAATAVKAAVAALNGAREAALRHEKLAAQLAGGQTEASSLNAELDGLRRERLGLVVQVTSDETATDEDVAAQAELFAQRAREARDAYEEARVARAELAARLDEGDPAGVRDTARERTEALARQALDTVEQYAVFAIARRLVADALDGYRKDRQPAVLRRATAIFGGLTGGRYSEVTTEFGSFSPYVVSASGTRLSPAELSTATREQLYLAMRVAYIEEDLAQADEALPVFMDDVLVNFDERRRDAAIGMLSELATHRQVVYFTCHPSTAASFASSAPAHVLIELARCGESG